MNSKTRQWLVTARKKMNITQEEVAKKINVSRTAYARYETGERTPSPTTANKIENILGVKKEYFFWSPECQLST